MELTTQLVVMGACGAACAFLANSRGRNPIGWFVGGGLTFGAGIVAVFVLSDLKKQQAMQQRLSDEASRVQEGLEEQRRAAYARHPDSQGPTHEEGSLNASATESPDSELHMHYQDSNWFHDNQGQCHGPMPFETLHLTWLSESINGKTLVWRKGMDVWVAIEDLDGMTTALDG
ncbi:MAG: GYF domain-containing protein [Planctomycetota bacterium]|nr:GYF domain-containing protein [Planctomycetota bacterium]MDG2142845.1 GYF domain-containing protein [Planctomycetota bacterium]